MGTSFEEYLKRHSITSDIDLYKSKFVKILSNDDYDLDNSLELNNDQKEHSSLWRRLSFRYFNVYYQDTYIASLSLALTIRDSYIYQLSINFEENKDK